MDPSTRDLDLLEGTQQRATKMLKGLEFPCYEEEPWGDLININKFLKGGCREDGARLLLVVPSAKKRSNGDRRGHGRFHLNTRQHFCAVLVMEPQHRMPREVLGNPPWRSANPPGHGGRHPAVGGPD